MNTALLVGMGVGAIIGLFHAWNVYTRRVSEAARTGERPGTAQASAAYSALWTFGLWVVFGSYVFYLWLLSVVVFGLSQAVKGSRNLLSST